MVCYYRIAALPYCRIAVLPYYHTIEHLTCLLAVIRKTLLASKKAMMCKPRTLLATRRAQEDREGQSAFRHWHWYWHGIKRAQIAWSIIIIISKRRGRYTRTAIGEC